jgi:hypothetical protein
MSVHCYLVGAYSSPFPYYDDLGKRVTVTLCNAMRCGRCVSSLQLRAHGAQNAVNGNLIRQADLRPQCYRKRKPFSDNIHFPSLGSHYLGCFCDP